MELESKAKELRQNLGTKKRSETEEQTKSRMKKVLSVRDEALQEIYDYQEKTGIPTKEEADKHFFEIEAVQED